MVSRKSDSTISTFVFSSVTKIVKSRDSSNLPIPKELLDGACSLFENNAIRITIKSQTMTLYRIRTVYVSSIPFAIILLGV